jgi:hypothetical protein
MKFRQNLLNVSEVEMGKHKYTQKEWVPQHCTLLMSRTKSRLERNKINEETNHNRNILLLLLLSLALQPSVAYGLLAHDVS